MIRAVVVLVALTGCSVVLTSRPPPASPPPATYPTCIPHAGPEILDAVIAAIATTGVIYFAQSNDRNANVGMAIEGAIAIGFGLSAIATLSRPAGCRAAREAFRTRPPAAYPPPPGYYPPPSYPPPSGSSYPPPPAPR